MAMGLTPEEMRAIFDHTEVIRRPRYGIVRGYHDLPYVCLGQSFETSHSTTRVRGRVHVSPRLLIRPPHCEPSYAEIFGEDNVDSALQARIFGFLGFRSRPVECASEHLDLKHLDATVDRVLAETLDELERMEDITTGVIITPNSRYFPVSVERFISSVVEDEFSV
ncbi:MAG TPA: hypothetical protein PLO37_15990 [Candidatus Hydrogenedentes bacterium]|nr:hypothetical protein [Candidatus Hydrogenedentota bacterium]HPG68348.1 hypothetical protein [Candidatus Hydrogenedentota bacterium]